MALWRRSVVFALLAAGMATAATAAVSIRPAAGAPDPKQMVLVAADLGGASVSDQGYYYDEDFPSVVSYSRTFREGAVGSTDLLMIGSDAEIGTSAQSTARFVRVARQTFASKAFRKVLKESLAGSLGEDGTVTGFTVGKPRPLAAGDEGFDLHMSLRLAGMHVDVHMTVFRVERALGSLLTLGAPGERVSIAVPRKLATIMAGRMHAELSPVATRVPVITGTAQEGQTLAASKGVWLRKPSSYAYQWRRCNAAGEACSAIPGATGATYVLVAADVGSTMRVAVTARNSVGSALAVSAQTAVVAPSAPPGNSSPPVITGLAQQGQMLTGSTGTWSGSPTSFAYQWQRCDTTGAACADVPAATAQTYAVGPADAGFRLRLAVTATNAAGSATAVSAPTDAIP